MRKRWGFYHGGLMMLLYADLMAFIMLLFLYIYPYTLSISQP